MKIKSRRGISGHKQIPISSRKGRFPDFPTKEKTNGGEKNARRRM